MDIMKTSSLTKHQVLQWIGACLYGNVTRKKVIYIKVLGVELSFLYLSFSHDCLQTLICKFKAL